LVIYEGSYTTAEGYNMHIRSTTDPITLHDVPDPDNHPCLYEGDGENGLEIYFENEENKRIYMKMELEDRKVLEGNDSDDYVAEG
jgi:hypothetical protein